jgi:hypothetical protein
VSGESPLGSSRIRIPQFVSKSAGFHIDVDYPAS